MSTAGGRITAGVGANLIGQHAQDRNQEATVYAGNLDPQMTEELVWELFVQAGPVVNVYLPKDRVTNNHQGYGFVEFRTEEDADYLISMLHAQAVKVLNMIKVFGKPIRVNKASQDKRSQDVGANLFIGNLDPEVDEKLLYDTFSAFGVISQTPKIMRDPDTGVSRGFGFVSYDSFEASDAAIEAMNGQFLCNRAVSVGYAFKKDTKGERHGTPAERMLAEQMRMNMAAQSRPNQLFAAGPKQRPETGQQVDAPSHGMGAAAPPPPMFGAPPRGMPNGTHMPPPPSAWPPARPPPPTFMQPPPMAQPSGPPPGMGPPPQQQQMGAPPMAGQPPPWMAPPGMPWMAGAPPGFPPGAPPTGAPPPGFPPPSRPPPGYMPPPGAPWMRPPGMQ